MFTGKWVTGLEGADELLNVRNICGLGGADELDKLSRHAVLLKEGKCVGTGRLFYGKDGFEIGKVCVLPEYRRQKVGDTLMRMLIWIGFEFGNELYVSADAEAAGFFKKYGFAETGESGVYKLSKTNYACGCCSHA